MKIILYGDGEAEPLPDQVAQLAQEVYNNDVLQLLVLNIWRFEFEVGKERKGKERKEHKPLNPSFQRFWKVWS